MSVSPTRNVKTVSNLIVEFPRQLQDWRRIQERGMGKIDRTRMMQHNPMLFGKLERQWMLSIFDIAFK
jgi:hypothetical protein